MQKFDAPQSQLQDPSMWPDGWYVYDNNTVEGPFSASQAFSRQQTTDDGRQVLVSRKGFTQWYALKDLADIFKMTENLGRRVAEEKGFEALRQLASTQIQTGVSQQPLAPKIVKKQVGPVLSPARAPTPPAQPTQMAAAMMTPEYRSPMTAQTAEKSAPVITAKDAKAKTAKATEQNKVLQSYFFVRGRLRLGKIRSPWVSAFFGVPLTLGVLWPLWLRTFLREVYMHAANHVKIPSSLVVAAAVPGLHFYAIYKTAVLVQAMEAQNGYKSVSPWLATAFGVFPPVAMAYLQDAANRHWLLHARHTGE